MLKKITGVFILAEAAILAHTGTGSVSGFGAGFSHPVGGADHILAMIAVGLWAAQMGGRALWAVPLSFVLMMVAGAAMGIQVPFIEEGILASVLVLGGLIGFGVKMPVMFSSAIVGLFAIFHGTAHGAEMPLNAGGVEYAAGFVLATALLHIGGIAIGLAMHKLSESKASRAAGGAIAASGLALVLS
ncbi:HupE/UreJ family protein [Sulfuricurvum sp.]|uniref:HupE/UreJ family protein n=1 Tax=Sulfuricurvum sp. TaxID=2025608 RepID=UPI003C4BB872